MNKFVKAIAAIAAATICAVPMMSTMSANAAVSQDYDYFDYNEDGNIDSTDARIMEDYIIARKNGLTSVVKNLENKYGYLNHFCLFSYYGGEDYMRADINRDGKIDINDAKMLAIAGKYYPSYTGSKHPNQQDFVYHTNGGFVAGDANGDGRFNIHDANALAIYLMCPVEDTPKVLFDRSNYDKDGYLYRYCELNWNDYKKMLSDLGIKSVWQGFTADKSTLQKVLDALKNGDYELIIREKILKGDTNGDGKVNMTDVIVLQQYLMNPVKYPTAGKYLLNGNNFGAPDEHGSLDIGDLVTVQMIVSGYKLSNGHVDINAKTKIKGKEQYVFSYYYDIYQAQAIKEGWNKQY